MSLAVATFLKRWLLGVMGILMLVLVWGSPVMAQKVLPLITEPLPQPALPVLDLANLLTVGEEQHLNQQLAALEQDTGWKLRLLTQFDQSPGRQVKEYWDLNEKSVLMVADPKGGNLLAFNVGDAVRSILPRTFWIELQSRFGNQFFTREHGSDFAIQATVDTLETCFRQGGCRVVPGLPQEQWLLTLTTSIAGGILLGFAGKPRHSNEIFNWRWALAFSPLWFILYGVFGIGPVVSRTQDWLPLLRNTLAFLGAILAIYVVPIKSRWAAEEDG